MDVPRQSIKALGKQILNPQQSNFNQTNIKNIPLGTQFANPTQDHMKQQSDLPINEPITIDGLSQKGSQKVKPKISFKLAYLFTVIGILTTFAYQINIFLKA